MIAYVFQKDPENFQSSSIFWISGKSLTKKICRNSRTVNDIDMKLGPVNKT